MRLDSHQHFWIYDPEVYSWINDEMSILKKDFLPPALQHETLKLQMDGTIAVQARQELAENDFLIGLYDNHPDLIKGVVGWVDLCSEEVEYQLDLYTQYEVFKGVRHIVQDEPDDDFMLRPDFQNGISKLAAYGLTYDILTFPRHLTRAIRLVDRFPDQKFVMDHISKPEISSGETGTWKEHMRFLASNPNVYCKLSGMVTETHWDNWNEQDFYPYLDAVFEAFGANRLMIGSDWPVCLLSDQYVPVMNIVINYVNMYYPEAINSVMGDSCAEFYGIR